MAPEIESHLQIRRPVSNHQPWPWDKNFGIWIYFHDRLRNSDNQVYNNHFPISINKSNLEPSKF